MARPNLLPLKIGRSIPEIKLKITRDIAQRSVGDPAANADKGVRLFPGGKRKESERKIEGRKVRGNAERIHERGVSAKTFADVSFINRSLIRAAHRRIDSPSDDVVNEIIRCELVSLFAKPPVPFFGGQACSSDRLMSHYGPKRGKSC